MEEELSREVSDPETEASEDEEPIEEIDLAGDEDDGERNSESLLAHVDVEEEELESEPLFMDDDDDGQGQNGDVKEKTEGTEAPAHDEEESHDHDHEPEGEENSELSEKLFQLPLGRIKKIMKLDEETNLIGKDAMVAVAIITVSSTWTCQLYCCKPNMIFVL